MPIFWIDPKHCDPPHAVTHPPRLVGILNSLATIGWDGPPLTGYLNFGRITLLSGSHRFEAALRLGIKLPVEVHPLKEVSDAWGHPDVWRKIMESPLIIQKKFSAIDKAQSVVGNIGSSILALLEVGEAGNRLLLNTTCVIMRAYEQEIRIRQKT